MKSLRIKEIIIALLLTSFLIACGGGSSNTPDPNPTLVVGVTVLPASINVFTERESDSFSVTVTGSTNTGYTVSADPAGAGCPTGAQSGNQFRCTPTAAGTYTITVTASADTSKTRTATLVVTDPVAPSQTANCTGTFGTGSKKATIAVASNFRLPAYELIETYFQATSYGDDTEVTVCGDSTGTLISEINGGNPRNYVMLFVADESARNEFGSAAFTYAQGVPLLAAMKTAVPNAAGLITGTPALSGDAVTITEGGAELGEKYQINTASAGQVSVADPGQAPYGRAAQLILEDLMDVDIPDDIPSWVFSGGNAANGLWNNIDRTWWAFNGNSGNDAIVAAADTGNIKSGIVAKSQICGQIAPQVVNSPYVYVEFTHTDYIRNQTAVVVDPGDPVASGLKAYIDEAMTDGRWATFLEGNCYLNPAN